jgi:hypothetical protein
MRQPPPWEFLRGFGSLTRLTVKARFERESLERG